MANFAQLDEKNNVINVIVVDNSNTCDENGIEKEEIGIKFLKSIFGEETIWIQASYNSNIRKYFPSIGWTYNKKLDIFVTPKPFNSWVFSKKTGHWEPPVTPPIITEIDPNSPTLQKFPIWNEENLQWNYLD